MFCFVFFQTQACEILGPQPGIELALPALESEVLTTEPPGKSHISSVKDVVYTILGFVLIFISGSSVMNGLLFLSRSVFHPLLPSSGSRNCVQSCCALWFPDGCETGETLAGDGKVRAQDTGYLFPGLPQPDQWRLLFATEVCSSVNRLLSYWLEWTSESRSVVSDSLWHDGLHSAWDSPGQNTGVGSLSLLQGIFPTQGSNPGLPHHRQILYQLSHKGSPRILKWVAYPFSRGSSWARNRTGVSCIAGRFFTNWAIREALNWQGDWLIMGNRENLWELLC